MLQPAIGALIMALSDVIVVVNSQILRYKRS
jgi:cation transport ATPase